MPPVSHRKFFVPFSKVDEPKRTVWGIAQDESIDSQDELITYEASVDAFSAWAGNIREQHDNTKAVGKAIDVVADAEKRLITVGARISLGAEDTWLKVLDGTLTGFSIGGVIQDSEQVHSEKLKRPVRKVTKYELYELSLVDVPANAHCVITAVQKRGTTLVATDVLGNVPGALTACDVLTTKKERSPMATRAKVKPVLEFLSKAAANNEEFVLVRTSDFQKSKDGSFILKGSSPMSQVMRKEDFDADGYSDDSDDTTGDDSTDDADDMKDKVMDHIDDMAKMHKAMCKTMGVDDNEQKYMDATRDDEDEDGDSGMEDDMGSGDDMEMSRSKSRGSRVSRKTVKSRSRSASRATPSPLQAEVAALRTELSNLTKSLKGSESAPRIGGATAETLLVTNKSVGTDTSVLGQLETKLAELNVKKDEFIAKGTRGVSNEERRERAALGDSIMRVTEQIALVKKATPSA